MQLKVPGCVGLQIFHHRLGGGAFEHPHPSISAPIGRREKQNKKDVLKLVKNGYETTPVIFRVR